MPSRFPERNRGFRPLAIQALLLMGFWLLFSGRYDAFHVIAGVLSVLIVLGLNRRLFTVRLFPADVHRDLAPIRMARYVGWLIGQIVMAALQVARIVLSRRLHVDPSLVEFHADLPNASAQTVVANSITLTPGTVTVDLDQGVFLVHALTDRSRDGLLQGGIPARVAALFGGEETGEITDSNIFDSEDD
jgi:multicomponent Na+:H+ antiporter subunit E